MKFALITDNSAKISEKFLKNENLFVLEIPISIDGNDIHTMEMSHESYYQLMERAIDVPKTSQPNVIDLENLLKKLESDGFTHVLGLFLSSGISGFYQNAYYLQNEFPHMTVNFPETNITSRPLGFMVETALTMAENGAAFDEILVKFDQQAATDNAFMLVDDLKWLAKGG